MSEQENINIVKTAYSNFANGNIEGVLNALAEDIVWDTPEMEGIPYAGIFNGREEVAQFFSNMAEAEQTELFEPQEFIAQDNKVAAKGRYAATVNSTGRRFELNFVHIFTIENGMIANFFEMMDTAKIVSAFQKAQTA